MEDPDRDSTWEDEDEEEDGGGPSAGGDDGGEAGVRGAAEDEEADEDEGEEAWSRALQVHPRPVPAPQNGSQALLWEKLPTLPPEVGVGGSEPSPGDPTWGPTASPAMPCSPPCSSCSLII